MNARQAAKMAAKRIEELEHYNRMSRATIVSLYRALDAIFSGGNVCELCEDYEECQLEDKKEGKGCADWSHKTPNPSDVSDEKIVAMDSKLEPCAVEGSMGGTDES